MTAHTLVIEGRPPTTNKMRTLHHHARATVDAQWRKAGWVAALRLNVDRMSRVNVTAQGRYPDRRALPDCDAIHPGLKAVLDGIVDADVLPDDRPPFVQSITYLAPIVVRDAPAALVVTITDAGQPENQAKEK